MFSAYIEEASKICSAEEAHQVTRKAYVDESLPSWPRSDDQIIFSSDTGCDLGPAGQPSVSLLLPTSRRGLVEDGAITLIGPDVAQCKGREMAFGKLIMVQGHGFDEDNLFRRYQQMSLQRFDLALEGCVPRGVPQQNREWLRISKDAIARGISFKVIGNELYRQLRTLDYVDAAEVVFITSGAQDVRALESLSQRLGKAVRAMNKMTEHLAYDCDECECKDVCNEIDGLRRMHKHALASEG